MSEEQGGLWLVASRNEESGQWTVNTYSNEDDAGHAYDSAVESDLLAVGPYAISPEFAVALQAGEDVEQLLFEFLELVDLLVNDVAAVTEDSN